VLRTNLSTRPFYNERAVHWGLGLALVAILALTAFNVTRVLALSQQQSVLAVAAERDEAKARELTSAAASLRASIDQAALEHVVHAAQEANEIIDQRTFSWTELLNHIERTLPPGVMLTTVTPRIDKGRFHVQMVVLGRAVETVDDFIEKLEATHVFARVLANTERINESGLYEVAIIGEYQPSSQPAIEAPPADDTSAAPAPAPAAPSPAASPAPAASGPTAPTTSAAGSPTRGTPPSSTSPGTPPARGGNRAKPGAPPRVVP